MKITVLPGHVFGLGNIPEICSKVIPTISLPDSCIMKNGNPLYIPDFDSSFSACFFFAVKINRLGKSIAPKFAHRYYSEAAPVALICADNLLQSLQESGLPWNAALGFDRSVNIGNFMDYKKLREANPLEAVVRSTHESEIELQNTTEIELQVPEYAEVADAITSVSRYNSLKMGDLLLIPASDTRIPLSINSIITISLDGENILKLPVK